MDLPSSGDGGFRSERVSIMQSDTPDGVHNKMQAAEPVRLAVPGP